MTLGSSLSKFLKDYRHKEKLSQGELASRLGFSRGAVNKWEGEEDAGTLTLNQAEKIAEITHTPVPVVLGLPAPSAEPTNAQLLEEIRALKAAPSDPLIRELVGLFLEVHETKRSEVLSWLRRYVAGAKSAKAVNKARDSG